MLGKIKNFIHSKKTFWTAFGIIIAIGIFLRIYHFNDWLIFNPDQARDASLIQEMLDGKDWPLLGPQAGSTSFKLGPIFYYFEFISAKIFGNTPPVLAYPDLITSLLSLPLMYFFMRKFFDPVIALCSTFVYSISFFSIYYSRFAFNPNSIPFYSILFLYGISEIMQFGKKKEQLSWAVLVGIAIGIGVQLHTLLFLLMPAFTFAVFLYIFFKRKFIWKSLLVIIAVVVILNLPVVIYEVQSGGKNMHRFFKGTHRDANVGLSDLFPKISNDAFCHIQGYTHIISSRGSGDKCNLMKLPSRIQKGKVEPLSLQVLTVLGGAIFLFGGYILLWWYFLKENVVRRKEMFGLAVMYISLSFLVFIPISSGISIRYFNIEIVGPFILLGVWLIFLRRILNKYLGWLAVIMFVGFLAYTNVASLAQAHSRFSAGKASDANTAILGEMIPMVEYVTSSQNGKQILFTGKNAYEKRFAEPLSYLLQKKGVRLVELRKKNKNPDQRLPIFYITKSSAKKYQAGDEIKGFVIESHRKFKNVELFKVSYIPSAQSSR